MVWLQVAWADWLVLCQAKSAVSRFRYNGNAFSDHKCAAAFSVLGDVVSACLWKPGGVSVMFPDRASLLFTAIAD